METIPLSESEKKSFGKSPVSIVKKEETDNIIANVRQMVKNIAEGKELSLVNPSSKSSLTMREDGYTSIVSSDKTQSKLDTSGKELAMTQESIVLANRRTLEVEDLVINNHKMNPLLLSYTDGVTVLGQKDSFVSRFRMDGTVIVKAWDAVKKSYTYIRRPAAVMPFSPRMNTAKIPEDLGVKDTIKETIEDITKSNQQVARSVAVESKTVKEDTKKDSKSSKKKNKSSNKKEDAVPSGSTTYNGTPITKNTSAPKEDKKDKQKAKTKTKDKEKASEVKPKTSKATKK